MYIPPWQSTRNVLPALRGFSAAYTYTWPKEVDEVLPKHYKDRCIEFLTTEPRAVHYVPRKEKWEMKHGQIYPVQNIEIKCIYPSFSNYGIWGGEGIVHGFTKKDTGKGARYASRIPRFFWPHLITRAMYSEIFDQWLKITVTPTTVQLVDKHMGFDYYILETCERHLNSQLAMKIKRDMLVSLAKESMYPNDPQKKEGILKRYKKFAIPLEEAEWIGLSPEEALEKLKEDYAKEHPVIPLKETLTEDYIKYLRAKKEEQIEA